MYQILFIYLFANRHKTFISLCEKLKVMLSDEVSPTSAHPLLEQSIQIQEVELNKVKMLI